MDMDIPGLSLDGHSYSGMRSYSDMMGRGEGWTFLVYPWMITVTPAYGDTLTWSGRRGSVRAKREARVGEMLPTRAVG